MTEELKKQLTEELNELSSIMVKSWKKPKAKKIKQLMIIVGAMTQGAEWMYAKLSDEPTAGILFPSPDSKKNKKQSFEDKVKEAINKSSTGGTK